MNTIKKIGRMMLSFLLLLLVASCGSSTKKNNKLNPEQIESKYSSGVVLIKNSYYYTISFNKGTAFYFTGIDSNGDPENLTLDPNELSPAVAYGTGFFISKDGMIATNSHVASPNVDISSARSSIMDSFRSMAKECSKEINDINEKLGIIQLAIIAADSNSDKRQLQQTYDELVEERDLSQKVVNMVYSLGGTDYEATLHTNIGVAYNDTHVTNMSDFHDCVTVADDPSHDLAIIQLKDKVTPEKKYVFRVPKEKSSKSSDENGESKKNGVRVGKKLYMIGFNLGPTLALTNNGIKAQVTSGEVSQDTDDAQIMYTISSLHGSSGSPVIDEYGKLIAVNYAGVDMTQNFNYGVKASHLKKLLTKLKDE